MNITRNRYLIYNKSGYDFKILKFNRKTTKKTYKTLLSKNLGR